MSKPDKYGWLPIETAPNDFGLKILIVGGAWPEPDIVGADGDWWRFRLRESPDAKGTPTHWQPLPKPPVQP